MQAYFSVSATKVTCDHFAVGAPHSSLSCFQQFSSGLRLAARRQFLMKLLGGQSKSPLWRYCCWFFFFYERGLVDGYSARIVWCLSAFCTRRDLWPCLVLKNFQDSSSHRIFDRMHEVLNIIENKN